MANELSNQLRYDGKVALITGAGNGLGREYALLFGARGARVVVNDLGGSAYGGGKSSSAADKVVTEIQALGGEAVASHDSVEDGDKIVQSALDAFGTLDIVVNNAGILRDVSFHKMSADDWDLIYRVHLLGTKRVTQAAWPILRDKGYGRVVMTTSAAGIYGNFGQANYCAAKLGLLGLSNCLAEEGRSRNIHVNTIAPIAASRLLSTVLPESVTAALKPEYVSPIVAWLCHQDCKETKGLFEVGAGYAAKLRWERAQGHFFPAGRAFSVDEVAAKWERIGDFANNTHPASTTESFTAILQGLSAPRRGGNEFIDLDEAYQDRIEAESSYDERDLSLYALGVGAARDALDAKDLPFVYELGESFQALPTYGVMPALNSFLNLAREGRGLKGLNYGLDRVLHGEQYTEIMRPLPPKAKLKHSFCLKTAYDKDPNALVILAVDTLDDSGDKLAYNEISLFIRKAGGWGGERGPSADINVPPAREPDAVVEERVDGNQTLLYRLSGDWNPLHADPVFAKAFGFDKPILHGLCTYGFVGRHVVKSFCNNDGRRFRSIKVRFADSVFPGETLVTKMWKESDTRIVFETKVKERDAVVIRNAAVELYQEIPRTQAKQTAAVAQPAAAVTAAATASRLTAADAFEVLKGYVAAHPELAGQVKTVFQFRIHNPDSDWVLDLKNGGGECKPGIAEKPDCTLELDEEHVETVVTRPMGEVQKLYFNGKLKIGGNIMASQKLSAIQGIGAKPYEEAEARRVAAANGAVAATAAPATAAATKTQAKPADTAANSQAAAIFSALDQRLKADQKTLNGLAGQILQFRVREPEASWVVDLSGKTPKVEQGQSAQAVAAFGIADADLAALAKGQAEAKELFQRGRLRVDGDVRLAHELGVLSKLI